MDSTDAAVKAVRPPKPYHPSDLCPCHGCRIAYTRARQEFQRILEIVSEEIKSYSGDLTGDVESDSLIRQGGYMSLALMKMKVERIEYDDH